MVEIKKKKMKGLTLIETLLVLGVIAFVIANVVSFYMNATGQTKLNSAKTQIQAIGSGVKSLYASQSTYTSVTTSLVVNGGLAPANAVDGSALVNPWGGTTIVTGASRTFEIVMNDIPQDACVNFISAGMISTGNIVQMSAGAVNFTADADPAAAVTACSGATNSVGFTFQ